MVASDRRRYEPPCGTIVAVFAITDTSMEHAVLLDSPRIDARRWCAGEGQRRSRVHRRAEAHCP